MNGYLVIREDSKWTDVFQLSAGRTVYIGRAATNQIVVKDERASRYHAEVFLSRGKWVLRDLQSRNGTYIGQTRVQGDHDLSTGEVVRIADCQIAYVHELSEVFSDTSKLLKPSDTVVLAPQDEVTLDPQTSFEDPDPIITHRRSVTRFLDGGNDDGGLTSIGQPAAKILKLAFDLSKQTDVSAVANMALAGLIESTNVTAGAVLLVANIAAAEIRDRDLEVKASTSTNGLVYRRLPPFLASCVLREGEAVLARNIEGDASLATADSQGEIHSKAVMCAPIRSGGKVIGLIHLYSTDPDRSPTPDDLEFTLAVAENVSIAVGNLNQKQELTEIISKTQSELTQHRKMLGHESQIVGKSPALLKVQQEVNRAAPTQAHVLIRGESGVGKELVARAVHFGSPRSKGPFVCLNCAALSETLLESELFGHEKGAFTGATERKFGKFESANQGTILLDEIGEMSPNLQAKFLRVLEGHPFERLGGSQQVKVNVRVIAATNRDLEKAVEQNQFRADLYFRLRVVEIRIPPLRKRTSDIPELANFFLDKFNHETGRRIKGFTPNAMQAMTTYRWPGNIRELKNVVERAVVLAQGDMLDIEDLNLSTLRLPSDSGEISLQPAAAYQPSTLDDIERNHILATLQATKWNKSRTAELLGIERTTLDRKIKRYNLVQP
jgi:transcriptional regulator with GAF, ATPase, and Fis domain